MAYAALTSLADVIHRNLEQVENYASICTKDQMISLLQHVSLLQQFLEDFSSKSFLPEDIDVFESRIRDTAYKMEDTIELVILKIILCCFKFKKSDVSESGEESEIDVQIPTPNDFASCFEDVQMLVKEAMEMKRIIDNDANLETLHPLTSATSSRADIGQRYPNSTTVVGLDKPLGQILDQLTGYDSMLRIVPVTGMGGIGKTTLAKTAFDRLADHFDLRLWVTVSQEYSIQDILQRLLPEAQRSDRRDEQELIEYVHKRLKGRRYLILLDDMWDEKVWDRVRNAFPDDKKGSRVIITTRLSRVGSCVGSSSSVHEMQFLNEDQSWELLRENVYGHEHHSNEFEGIGKMIAKNCKGLPLALVVTAGLLKFNKTIAYWKQVARNANEKAITNDDHLLEILSWSYTRLPPHLKACFLYMGLYREDYEIPTKELLRLWAAEGFLKPKDSRSMEEVAEECLQELVERSLVLVTKRWYNGKIKTCSVHDALREVSIRKAEEEKFYYHIMLGDNHKSIGGVLADQRRVSVTDWYHHTFLLPRDTFAVTTHSLIDQNRFSFPSSEYIKSIAQCFKLLRVHYKAQIEEDYHLRILCTLTNLRYLHIVLPKGGGQFEFPESISMLQNLETLIVERLWNSIIVVFPREIWELQRLRHILIFEGNMRIYEGNGQQFPVPNQGCPSLQTLCGVMDFNITRSLSERIPNLKILKLYYEDGNYTMESLQYLYQLEVLCIRSIGSLLTNFVFPQNLRKLSLFGTKIPWENLSPTIGSLRELKVLKLKFQSVSGEVWEPIEGEFLQLEHLKMEKLGIKHWVVESIEGEFLQLDLKTEDLGIKHWVVESIHFPRLRKLVILDCHYLEEVPESIGEIDTLETLIVKAYIYTVRRSVEHIKESQQQMGNHLLQVILI